MEPPVRENPSDASVLAILTDASPQADAWRSSCEVELTGEIAGQTPWGPIELSAVHAQAFGGSWDAYPFDVIVVGEDAEQRRMELRFTVTEPAPTEFHGEGWVSWMGAPSEPVVLDVDIEVLEMDGWAECSDGPPYAIKVSISALGAGWHIKDALIEGTFCDWWRTVCTDAPSARCI